MTVQTLMILTLLAKSFASIFVNFMAYSKHLHCGQMTSRKTKDPYLFSCLYFLYVCSCIQLFPRAQLHPASDSCSIHLIFGSTKYILNPTKSSKTKEINFLNCLIYILRLNLFYYMLNL